MLSNQWQVAAGSVARRLALHLPWPAAHYGMCVVREQNCCCHLIPLSHCLLGADAARHVSDLRPGAGPHLAGVQGGELCCRAAWLRACPDWGLFAGDCSTGCLLILDMPFQPTPPAGPDLRVGLPAALPLRRGQRQDGAGGPEAGERGAVHMRRCICLSDAACSCHQLINC